MAGSPEAAEPWQGAGVQGRGLSSQVTLRQMEPRLCPLTQPSVIVHDQLQTLWGCPVCLPCPRASIDVHRGVLGPGVEARLGLWCCVLFLGPGVPSQDAWPGLRGTPPPLSKTDLS